MNCPCGQNIQESDIERTKYIWTFTCYKCKKIYRGMKGSAILHTTLMPEDDDPGVMIASEMLSIPMGIVDGLPCYMVII